MQNNDNQKTYFIYVRSTGEKVPVTKEQHNSFYKEADRIRHKEQDHGRCMCPYRFIWKLFARLRELDPEADTIIQLWKDHPEGISDRAIARELGRPQKTFADQMKKYRTDLRRITGDK